MDHEDIVGFEQPDDLLSTIVRYGLYAGAIFQAACIGACLLLVNNDDKDTSKVCDESDESDQQSQQLTPSKKNFRPRKTNNKKKK